MQPSLAFLLGLLDRSFPAYVTQEDFSGVHGPALRLWQQLGFLSRTPERHPVPSCPFCLVGVPYPLGEHSLCGTCQSPVERLHLLRWRFDLEAFLSWLARTLPLTGGVRQVEDSLWQLGSLTHGALLHECFYRRGGLLSERGRKRLLAYRSALLFQGLPRGEPIEEFRGPCLSLLEVLRQDRRSLKLMNLSQLLHGGGAVRFEAGTGALWAGDTWLGEVPVGSKEYFFLACLSQNVDQYVPYGDIKHEVLRQSGSTDTTDEATFCHKLKSRIKERRWVPKIDHLLATTKKGDGYRLRGHLEGS